jgi:dihydrofolate synthase/folylpolyglutamate synthase
MTHAETLRRLDERIGRGWRLGLDGMRRTLTNLPAVTYPVVLVGGTNGKGSVAAHLHRFFSDEGLRVGLTTSPHLRNVRERIVVGEEMVGEEEFDRLFADVVEADDGTATYFETLALMAILSFERRRVDLAVVEIGMGGRLDAFNVLDPLVSVVTSVGLEHTPWLGDSVEKIAVEKAQIARPGRPIVLGTDLPALAAEVRRIGGRVLVAPPADDDYRRANRDLARLAAEEIAAALGRPFDAERFDRATERTRWPGRFDVRPGAPPKSAIHGAPGDVRHPVAAGDTRSGSAGGTALPPAAAPEIIFDAAHNPPAARALAKVLAAHRRGRRVVAVVAFLADKDAAGLFAALASEVEAWIVTEIRAERARAAADVPRPAHATIEPDPARALEEARRQAGPDGIVLVTGSIYLLGELMTG